MKKKIPEIRISRLFIEYCWNISGEPHDVNIQYYRFFISLFSIPDLNQDLKTKEMFLKTFSYKKEGKTNYLMSYSKWKVFNVYLNSKLKYFFYINGESIQEWKKEREKTIKLIKEGKFPLISMKQDYFFNPYISIKESLWEKVKIWNLNELKIFHFILWHKIRGTYPIIKTNISEIKNKMMMGNRDDRLKYQITKTLEKLKKSDFIKNYEWDKHNIKIEK